MLKNNVKEKEKIKNNKGPWQRVKEEGSPLTYSK